MSNKKEAINADIADWSREEINGFWEPGKKLLKSIRSYQCSAEKSGVLNELMKKQSVFRYRFWSVVTGADIPLNCKFGQGLLIPHPNGIVIHPNAEIGINCLIHQQVTIGVKRGDNQPPVIHRHVDLGAGAKIIGNITIGHHALVGANAVVVRDVEPYAIVAGIPAKVIGFTNEKE